ncbi:NAD(P)H-dependent oxidoreductase [Phenylobacterium sp.]|uniref:NAD(P)H-dependent oxidoreductase n=1 Tax=Phenylobacterium sp. TaxID=1871053 RepID=UPI002FDB629C
MTARTRQILLINGHPDPRPERFCAALTEAYRRGAQRAGHSVLQVDVGTLDLPLVASQADFTAPPPPRVVELQEALKAADHLVLIYPLWLGGPPARLKAFLEQVFRYGVALSAPGEAGGLKRLLSGRSARVVVTMGMPGPVFRTVFLAHGLKSVSRGILWISGMSPVRETVIGSVEATDPSYRLSWLSRLERLGARGL